MLLTLIFLAILVLSLAVVWLAIETRLVHRSIDLYAQEVRLWTKMLSRLGAASFREKP